MTHIVSASLPASVFAMPIIVGGELRGLLSLTSSKPDAFAATDIAFLYHAANQLSTVLVALNRARELAPVFTARPFFKT